MTEAKEKVYRWAPEKDYEHCGRCFLRREEATEKCKSMFDDGHWWVWVKCYEEIEGD